MFQMWGMQRHRPTKKIEIIGSSALASVEGSNISFGREVLSVVMDLGMCTNEV